MCQRVTITRGFPCCMRSFVLLVRDPEAALATRRRGLTLPVSAECALSLAEIVVPERRRKKRAKDVFAISKLSLQPKGSAMLPR